MGFSSAQKNCVSKHISKPKSMAMDVGSEIVVDQNDNTKKQKKKDIYSPNLVYFLNCDDEEEPKKNSKGKKENKIEEINKSI